MLQEGFKAILDAPTRLYSHPGCSRMALKPFWMLKKGFKAMLVAPKRL